MLICSKSKYNTSLIPCGTGSQYYKKIGERYINYKKKFTAFARVHCIQLFGNMKEKIFV